MSEDLPAFGLPTIASERAGSTVRVSASAVSGSRSSIASDQRVNAKTMRGADRVSVETEPSEFGREIFVLRMIDLVYDEKHRTLRSAQDPREFLIDRRQPLLRIHHEENHIRFRASRLPRPCGPPEQLVSPYRRFRPCPRS